MNLELTVEDILKWLKRRYEMRTLQLKKFRDKGQQFILVILPIVLNK